MKLILDTDIDTDCDDAGALAILHHLANQGKVEILGIVCSIPVLACIACVRAINHWYSRPDLPVAMVSLEAWQRNPLYGTYLEHRASLDERGQLYNARVGRDFIKTGDKTPDALRFYRQTLSEQSDQNVTICAIGTLTALSELLHSGPDDISALTGRELIASKVKLLVSMAWAVLPAGQDSFNWRMDLPSAAAVVNQWPTPMVVQPLGTDVLTGRRFMGEAPVGHPVREAYAIYLGGTDRDRSSWDPLTVIYAVNGAGELFTEKTSLSLSLDHETGMHTWSKSKGRPERVYLDSAVDSGVLSSSVEDLMIASLFNTGEKSR